MFHMSNLSNELCAIRSKGMVGQVFNNGKNYSWHILTDEQYEIWCKNSPANVFAYGTEEHLESAKYEVLKVLNVL